MYFIINNKVFHKKDKKKIKGRRRFEREQGEYKSGIGLRKWKGENDLIISLNKTVCLYFHHKFII